MAEVVGTVSASISLVSLALQSSITLYQTVQSLQSRDKVIRELRRELEALQGVLQALDESVCILEIDFTAIEQLLMRCNNACGDFNAFIMKCTSSSTKHRRNWLNLRYMGEDITDFKEMLADYRLTISVVLGCADLRITKSIRAVLEENKGHRSGDEREEWVRLAEERADTINRNAICETALSYNDYTIGWICALPVEMAAAKLMLDKLHPPLPRLPMDQNGYILGNIGEHNVVIASLPIGVYGNTSATSVAMQLQSSFHAVRFGLMVGIGGGVPSSNADIRLGDIVVSQPSDTFGGVIQYDLGKMLSGGLFKRTGMLNRPPKVLLTALATLQAHHFTEDSQVVEFVSNIQAKIAPHKARMFARPIQEDCLFQADYDHVASDTCTNCDRSKLFPRLPREHQDPVIHYGLIGSANQVMKDSRRRDQLARDLGVSCVDMEAAGLMNDFPCLVIRGISDYADSHKNEEWQGYAAAVAAAYAKELLLALPADQPGVSV